MVLDEQECYPIGASLKDLGKKWFAFSKMEAKSVESILNSISQKQIENRIFTNRANQVTIDRDLAEMYQVETKVLNQAGTRNIERFSELFRFQLTDQ